MEKNIEDLFGQTKERLPVSQLVPLDDRATIDGDSELAVLVLLLLQVREHLLDQLPKIPDIFSNDHFCEQKKGPHLPPTWLFVFMNTSLSLLSPTGLYLELNLSNLIEIEIQM